jgi:alpha-beta hydrolase superfamily lysophospholipase
MQTFMRHNPTDNTPLHGEVIAAPKRARAVIAIVHGFGEHIGRYTPLGPLFENLGFAALGLDLHGHGRTPGPRGNVESYERLREDVDMLLDEASERFPDVPVFLWGHSMGGGLALDYTLTRGERGMKGVIATAPLIEAVDAPPAIALSILKLIRKFKPSFAINNEIDGTKISSQPEEQARYESDTLNHGRLGVGLGLGSLGVGKTLPARGARFPLPLLLMHARGDQLTRFEASQKFAANCPTCNFHPFEDVEHEMHNDTSRERVIALMTNFIESHL